LGTYVFPGVRQTARHKSAGACTADSDLVANLEREFAIQNVCCLVALVVKMEWGHSARRRCFLEHHHAFASLATLHLYRCRTPR
jgi:hypothetical protein